ncbi:MAG: beta-lactamase family protein [Rudaea sp.]|uniref:serine hydrolase domain-containing protein n=1 Tax=unclassified Rudaea TaxID=2627037 RepID=UPI0010F87870|nr:MULTISPECIES: serine hydrolase domain-containing protein [unclassified Rudaea]MBN8886195.1 beta-lactamase family protein [Rudaea sp.]
MKLRKACWNSLSLVFCLLLAVHAGVASAVEVDRAQVERYLEKLRVQSGAPGVSAAIMVKGELVYSGGVGLADVETGMAQDGTVVHNIGSISKTQAAIAVMQLVEQGKVNLDAEIQTYVPWFPRKQAPITVRQIMTHTSGIRHYKDGEFGEGEVLAFRQFDSIEEASKRWINEPLEFTPGSKRSYSSYATNLLQALIEKVSGQGYEEYLRVHVWQPAGMLDTQFDVPARIVPRRGRGYERDAKTGDLKNAAQENVSYKYAGGGVISTDEDLVRFGHAINRGLLLKPATLREMYRPQVPALYPNQGLIWFLETDPWGHRHVGHSGSVKGTSSDLVNYTESDLVVAVHVNAWAGKTEKGAEISEALAQLVLSQLPAGEAKDKTK